METEPLEMTCFVCAEEVRGDSLDALGLAFLAHVRAEHDMPFPDRAVRNYAEATQRLTGSADRLDAIGAVEVHPVDSGRVDDWLELFDHHGFVGKPEWAACYCLEPHVRSPEDVMQQSADVEHWRDNRAAMVERLHSGRAFGYLAYVDGAPAGWVNASMRGDYTLYRRGDGADPSDREVVGVSCFVVAPPFRNHGVARRLLERVVADAGGRGASWVEAYPFAGDHDGPDSFRGSRALYDSAGFDVVGERSHDVVVRRAAAV